MKKNRFRTMKCEVQVEEFYKGNPHLFTSEWDPYYVSMFRANNGGDPSHHQGPFREDQFYLDLGELLCVYPIAAMEFMGLGVNTDDYYFPVIWGALLALKKSDAQDTGWLYCEGKWHQRS
jgi:hypothetical protein